MKLLDVQTNLLLVCEGDRSAWIIQSLGCWSAAISQSLKVLTRSEFFVSSFVLASQYYLKFWIILRRIDDRQT